VKRSRLTEVRFDRLANTVEVGLPLGPSVVYAMPQADAFCVILLTACEPLHTASHEVALDCTDDKKLGAPEPV